MVQLSQSALHDEKLLQMALKRLVCAGLSQLITQAAELEAEQMLEQQSDLRLPDGHALVVRNGRCRPRRLHTRVGTLEVSLPRLHDRRPGHRITSHLLPPYIRALPVWCQDLPELLFEGLLFGNYVPAVHALTCNSNHALSDARQKELVDSMAMWWRDWRNSGPTRLALTELAVCCCDLDEGPIRSRWPECLVAVGADPEDELTIVDIEPAGENALAARASLVTRLRRLGLVCQDGALDAQERAST